MIKMTIENDVKKKEVITHQIVNLEFDCYEFYKFIEALEKYTDEIELVFENSEFSISFMDASRIMLAKCTKWLDKQTKIEKMVFGINASDLKNILKTRKKDNKEIVLIFDNTKTYIEIIKTSEKLNSRIERTLNILELNLENIPMDNLNKIEYTSKVSFSIKFMDDFFYESSNYSEIVNIEINENIGISFREEGTIGKSEYRIDSQYCSYLDGFGNGSYSYTFLTPIKPLLPILTDSEMTMNIKNDNPIRLELYIDSLDMDILIYLAPRVEEEEYDKWDDDEWDKKEEKYLEDLKKDKE